MTLETSSGSALPKWEQLCKYSHNEESHADFSTKVSHLKNSKPNLRYRLTRKFVTAVFKDPAITKFLDFSYEDIIDVIADQVAHNMTLNKTELGPAEFRGLNRKYAQQPCTPTTVDRRVKKALEMISKNDPILVLGDDDLVSVSLAEAGFTDVTALDIDQHVLTAIEGLAKSKNLKVKTQIYDLFDTPPKNLVRPYKLVFIDPNYSVPGVKLFLDGALELTSNSAGTKIFLSVHLLSLLRNGISDLSQILESKNCRVEEFYQGFNVYPAPKKVKGLISLVNQILIASRTLTTEGYAFPYLMSDAIILEKY
jgi:hypothetical protein